MSPELADTTGPGFVSFRSADVERSLPARFEQQVLRYSDNIAVKTANGQLTYRELNDRADELAAAIRERHGPASEPVAYFVSDDLKMVIAILGILKAGKFFVPMSPEHPTVRNRLVVHDAEPTAVIVDRNTWKSACDFVDERDLLNLDILPASAHADLPFLPANQVALNGDSLASILYSSGTTAQPKGVLQNHRNQLQNTMHHTNSLGITSSDRFCLLSSRTTQQALTGIFSALLNGAGLYPFRLKQEGLERLAHWIDEQQLTVYHSSASVFREFAKSFGERRQLRSLRVVKLGSESVARSDFELWKQYFSPPCIFVNALSSTETGTIAQFEASHTSQFEGNKVPTGAPLQGKDILLLDAENNPVPEGEAGEIVVRSRFLFPGYWKNQQETERVFLGGTDSEGRRMYRTGDLGKRLPNGTLLHLGRKDFRVKIRGNRVELSEIELALLELPGVQQAVVTAYQPMPDRTQLVAYVVPGNTTINEAHLRVQLRNQLPDYLVPGIFVLLPALPLTPQGKVDRRALPTPVHDHAISSPSYSVELQIAEIWKKVLGTDALNVQENFFEAGGDSLLAIRFIDELEHAFAKKLTPEIFISGGTIQSLANNVIKEWEPAPPALFFTPAGANTSATLFLIHGDYLGGGLYAVKLAQLLGPEIALCALQPLRRQVHPLPVSFAAMADENLARLRSAQPRGPYRLAGYCHGGFVALEMAQRLRAQGECVESLILIDVVARNADFRFYLHLANTYSRVFRLSPNQQMQLFADVKRFVSAVRAEKPFKRLPFLFKRSSGAVLHRLTASPRALFETTSNTPAISPTNEVAQRTSPPPDELFAHFHEMIDNYLPKRYDGPVVLLASEQRRQENDDPTLGWRTALKNLQIYPLRGTHHTCVTEHLPTLATQLKHCLSASHR